MSSLSLETTVKNRSMSTKMGVPLLSCASHRFQLQVKEIMPTEENTVAQVKSSDEEASDADHFGKACIETPLLPKY